MKNKNQKENWEKEFERNEDIAWIKQLVPKSSFNRLKEFIRQLLKQEKEKLLERIKKKWFPSKDEWNRITKPHCY